MIGYRSKTFRFAPRELRSRERRVGNRDLIAAAAESLLVYAKPQAGAMD